MPARSVTRGVSDRLEGLMVFRVVLVTIFLGSAIALDAGSLVNLAEFRNATLLGLIVSTYLLTVFYALAIRSGANPVVHARVQLGFDFLLAACLGLVTSGLDSLFLFLFYVVIISAAVVLGRPAALAAAAASISAFLGFALIDLGVLELPHIYGIFRPANVTIFRLAVNATAALMVGVLSGFLADRLGKTSEELARQKVDFADLKVLNLHILESLSSGLVTISTDGHIIFVNRAAHEITGLSHSAMMGHTIESVFPGLWESLASHHPIRRRESEFVRPDGTELFLGFSVSPLFDSTTQNIGHIIIFQDLTEIRELEAQMRRSERLAAVGQLSAAIAHEIRNPLASISGAVEMLEGESTNDSNRALMGIVMREVDRLNLLISDFLEYSRPHNLKRDEVDLMALSREVVSLAASRGTYTINLLGPQTALVLLDEQATRQILWNLINNAAEAGATTIRVLVNCETDRCHLVVEDDGTGIPANIRERIWEPFFTTKRKGTGLGLATIFRLMEEQQATITLIEPRVLSGAAFRLSFTRTQISEPESVSEPLSDLTETP